MRMGSGFLAFGNLHMQIIEKWRESKVMQSENFG